MRLTPPQGGPTESTGQLFWSTVQTSISEDNSLSFPVALDGRWHTYTLELKKSPRWTGTMDSLRLDPVALPDIRIEVDEIRLL